MGAEQLEWEGHCFTIPAVVDAQVRAYFDLGVPVTGIVYGTPAWARGQRPCTPIQTGFEIFCPPENVADYGRFAGLIASRYNGASGHGRVTDFVIQNEVNSNDWFDMGCGSGTACDPVPWVAEYAAVYNAAYDAIHPAQPLARVLFSFEHTFGTVLDNPGGVHPVLSVETFLKMLVPQVGARLWSVAIHPYPISSLTPLSDAVHSLPWITLANLGVLPGWLRAHYPDNPRAWEVQMTEVGLNNVGNRDAEQATALCDAFRNTLATPGVTSFIYHRLVDNPNEGGLALGLRHQNGSPKPAWLVWHDANDPAHPTCGFELGDHTLVQHGHDPADDSDWYSSRVLPAGYAPTGEIWQLDRNDGPGRVMLYECSLGLQSWISRDVTCGGNVPMGPVGTASLTSGPGLTKLWHCTTPLHHVVQVGAGCPDGRAEALGWVVDRSTSHPVSPTTTSLPNSSPGTSRPPASPAVPVRLTPTFTG